MSHRNKPTTTEVVTAIIVAVVASILIALLIFKFNPVNVRAFYFPQNVNKPVPKDSKASLTKEAYAFVQTTLEILTKLQETRFQ